MKKDTIYQDDNPKEGSFSFDAKVVPVFDDMIRRSVPGYPLLLQAQVSMLKELKPPKGLILDLGCSTGNWYQKLQSNDIDLSEYLGVDASPEMLAKFKEKSGDIDLLEADLEDWELPLDNSVVAMNFTLQFLSLECRDEMVKSIFDSLKPGGVFFLSEKVRPQDEKMAASCDEVYWNFKRSQGYSSEEVARKDKALKQMLRAESLDVHLDRLKRVGFDSVEVTFKWMHFTSIVAIKK